MNSTQITDSINAGIYSKNTSYPTPFSKGAYLEFVSQWKEIYAKLSKARRAQKLLRKKKNLDNEALKKEAVFVLPSALGFVTLNPFKWTDPVAFLLVLRKQMKLEVVKIRQSQLANPAPTSTPLQA